MQVDAEPKYTTSSSKCENFTSAAWTGNKNVSSA